MREMRFREAVLGSYRSVNAVDLLVQLNVCEEFFGFEGLNHFGKEFGFLPHASRNLVQHC